MINGQSIFFEAEDTFFGRQENEITKTAETVEVKEDVIFVRRRAEQPSLLELRFARLKKTLRSRSAGII